jgi:hypothetical protein
MGAQQPTRSAIRGTTGQQIALAARVSRMMSGDVRLSSKCWRFAAAAEREGFETKPPIPVFETGPHAP